MKHAVQFSGICQKFVFPCALSNAEEHITPAIQRHIWVIFRHILQAMVGRVQVDQIVHIAAQYLGSIIDAAEADGSVKTVRKAEKQIGSVESPILHPIVIAF